MKTDPRNQTQKYFMYKPHNLFCVFLVLTFLSACTSSYKVLYIQNAGIGPLNKDSLSYEPVLQPDDLLSIIVSAQNPESVAPFNLPQIPGNYDIGNNQNAIKTYLIDNEGEINFPVIGKIAIAGLSRRQANLKLQLLISDYVKGPEVNLRILNFKVTVLGEVNRPGIVFIKGERITLFEALANAGDLTIYGLRTDILLIREEQGVKAYHHINITQTDFMQSPYYYLNQNDILSVNPNKTKINAAGVGPNTSILVSTFSILLTQMVLLLK
jgi:polysaccharide export outer membrane protein